jgi:osmotically-inducible protein OsmY
VARERWWYHDRVEPTSRPAIATTDDRAITEALRAFVCALGSASVDVRLDYRAGVVTLTGAVASAIHRQAVEDLVAAHDGVTGIVSELRLAVPGVIASGF